MTGHHKHWREHGGPTVPQNLLGLCENCHSLVHDGLLVIRGAVPHGLRFLRKDGTSLRQLREPTGLGLNGGARAPREELVTVHDLPAEADADWLDRHAHLFDTSDPQGVRSFRPGTPKEPRAMKNGSHRSPKPTLADMIGQRRVLGSLQTAIGAARSCGQAVGHILFSGPPGLGKTTLARAVANEIGTGFHYASAPAVRNPSILLNRLCSMGERDVLFVDEIHRLPGPVAESIYEAMEDGCISFLVRSGNEQRTLRVRLRPFTLIGATSDEDLLPEAFHSRFRIRERLEFYRPHELARILVRAADREGHGLDDEAALLLAGVSRDTPREALVLLEAARDDAIVAGRSRIGRETAARALRRLRVDRNGLRPFERQYLDILRRAGRPMGLTTLAARLGATRKTVQRIYEPFLLRRGHVRLTPNGRCFVNPRGRS